MPVLTPSTRAARRRDPGSAYDKVNELLADVEAEFRRSFLTEAEKAIGDNFEPVVRLISSWNIAKARDFAWLNVLTLWELRRTRTLSPRQRGWEPLGDPLPLEVVPYGKSSLVK